MHLGIGHKTFKGKHFGLSNFTRPLYLNRKTWKKVKRKLGLTSDNRWIRGIKKRINLGAVSSYQPTSAATMPTYQYSGRTLSQLTGGV